MDAVDIAFATADDLARAFRQGTLTPVDVVEVFLTRIAAANGHLGAYIHVFEASARAEAEASRLRWRAGCPLGPLDGIPVAVKDLADIAGWPTSAGSAALKNAPPARQSATIVRRLRSAGAVILGKTHMVEFACGGWGSNEQLGTPRNPWDPARHRVPGGSSSGSAVAVAAGLATVAIGSDTGGSVRIPAALCGLTGLKTTFGRVSNAGVFPLARSLDTIGPLARSALDAALVYDAIHGPDPADESTLSVGPQPVSEQLPGDLSGLRLATLPASERKGVGPEVLRAYDRAIATLADAGAQMVEAALPESFDEVRTRCGQLIMAEGYAAARAWVERDDLPLDRHVRTRLLSGRDTGAAEYLDMLDDMRATRRRWGEALEHVDAVLTPTTPISAPTLEEVDENAFTLARFTRAGNYLGWCGCAVPIGLDDKGLPLSLQINGRAFCEGGVLGVAAAFQKLTDHHRQRPPVP